MQSYRLSILEIIEDKLLKIRFNSYKFLLKKFENFNLS